MGADIECPQVGYVVLDVPAIVCGSNIHHYDILSIVPGVWVAKVPRLARVALSSLSV